MEGGDVLFTKESLEDSTAEISDGTQDTTDTPESATADIQKSLHTRLGRVSAFGPSLDGSFYE